MRFNKGGTLAFALASFFLVTLVEKARGQPIIDQRTGQVTTYRLTDGQDCLSYQNTMLLFHILPQIYAEKNGNMIEIPAQVQDKYKWICQTDQNTNVQYITLYDIERNLPVYSAYKAAPYDANRKLTARKRPAWDSRQYQINNQDLASDADYTGDRASLIDRGHLFAAQFASDQDQFVSTFHITNVCAQDAIFNRKVWGHAERILKIQAMHDCQGKGWIPLVVTGAIPENMAIQDPAERRYFEIQQQNRRSITVPVLMWTTMWCIDPANGPQYHVSFIGQNGPMGDVMFYRKFSVFQAQLNSMYGQANINGAAWNQNIPNTYEVDITTSPEMSYANNVQMTKWTDNIRLQRFDFIETLLTNNFQQMGITVDVLAVEALRAGQTRKRRSVSGPVSSSEIQGNSTVALVHILDKDPKAEFRFTKCSFVEENIQTGTTQEHMLDMENDKLIESSDKTGSDLTGSFLGEDGTIQEMQEEVSKVKTISIILKPRTP